MRKNVYSSHYFNDVDKRLNKFAKYCWMMIMNQDDWITNINTKRRKTWFCLPLVNMQTHIEAIVPVNVLCKREKPFM